jgi:hypothetical protein
VQIRLLNPPLPEDGTTVSKHIANFVKTGENRHTGGGVISLWLHKKTNRFGTEKMYLGYSKYPPPTPTSSTHDFVVLASLTHPRKILLVVLQIEK